MYRHLRAAFAALLIFANSLLANPLALDECNDDGKITFGTRSDADALAFRSLLDVYREINSSEGSGAFSTNRIFRVNGNYAMPGFNFESNLFFTPVGGKIFLTLSAAPFVKFLFSPSNKVAVWEFEPIAGTPEYDRLTAFSQRLRPNWNGMVKNTIDSHLETADSTIYSLAFRCTTAVKGAERSLKSCAATVYVRDKDVDATKACFEKLKLAIQ